MCQSTDTRKPYQILLKTLKKYIADIRIKLNFMWEHNIFKNTKTFNFEEYVSDTWQS